jgi:CRISPR-associated protein Cas2
MPKRKLHIAAYDVRDPSRLRRMLRVIKDYATGGQKSAYECYLTPTEQIEMIERVMQTLDLGCDRFACIELRQSNRPKTLGKALMPQDLGYFYIG